MKKIAKLLGEMFIEKGLVTEDQVQDTVQEQIRNNTFVGELLVEKGLVTEDNLFETIAEQFAIDFVRLAEEKIDWDVSSGFSSSLITGHKCLPLRVDDNTVVVAITNPLDSWALDTAEKEAAPHKIKIVLMKNSDMDVAIKEYHKHSMRKMMNKWKKD